MTESFNPEIVNESSMFTPGCILWDNKGSAWCYVEAAEDISKSAVVMFQRDNVAMETSSARLNASTSEGSDRLGVARVDVPDNYFFWAQVFGIADVLTNGAIANLESYTYSTDTHGKLDDNSSSTHRTRNIVFMTAPNAAGTAVCMLAWPGGVRYV